jgi:hypothetical protein
MRAKQASGWVAVETTFVQSFSKSRGGERQAIVNSYDYSPVC